MRTFTNFAVIDWSGEAVARPKGLALAHCPAGSAAPVPLGPAEGWSRSGLRDWMLRHADVGTDLLIGLDLSPALPFCDEEAYFPGALDQPSTAKTLWAAVDAASTSDPHLGVASFLANPEIARHFRQHRRPGDRYPAGRGRLRVCEHGQLGQGLAPTSCFNLVGASQVGKSSLTGMRVLHAMGGRMPVWPFDPVPEHGPVIVEIYTSIAARASGMRRGRSKIRDASSLDSALAASGSVLHAALPRYDDHTTDAMLTAAWLRRAANDPGLWSPPALTSVIAATEGWTFGVR